jgi:hypothetical protein
MKKQKSLGQVAFENRDTEWKPGFKWDDVPMKTKRAFDKMAKAVEKEIWRQVVADLKKV